MDHVGIRDFSCEIDKPLSYLEYINDHLSTTTHRDQYGQIVLTDLQADAFSWMLSDAVSTIIDIKNALYPKTKPTA